MENLDTTFAPTAVILSESMLVDCKKLRRSSMTVLDEVALTLQP
jgi:hypothetical protein